MALRNELGFYYLDYELQGDDNVHVYPSLDIIVPNLGRFISNDTSLVYITGLGLVAGSRADMAHAFYREKNYAPGESKENINTPSLVLGFKFEGDFWSSD